MKKFLSILFVVVTVLALTACGKFTCNLCNQEKSGKKHTEEILGEKVTICDDCYGKIKNGLEGLGF